jgi:hypothetical protein
LGAPDSAEILVNGLSIGLASGKDLQLQASQIDSLELRIEVQNKGLSQRRRILYVRAPEAPVSQAVRWIGRLGAEVDESSDERVSGSQVISPPISSFSFWIDESVTGAAPSDEPALQAEPLSAPVNSDITFERAVRLLSDWKGELVGSVATTFISELAGLPGGSELSEGALQYKQAVALDSQPQFARAIKELRSSLKSSNPIVKTASFVLLQLALKRTGRPLASPPEVPDYARNLVDRLTTPESRNDAALSVQQLTVSDFSPVDEDSDTLQTLG